MPERLRDQITAGRHAALLGKLSGLGKEPSQKRGVYYPNAEMFPTVLGDTVLGDAG